MKYSGVILASLALAACQAGDELAVDNNLNETAAVPFDQAPPPGAQGLTLTVDGGIKTGGSLTFTIEGAQPNEDVFVLVGRAESPAFLCPVGNPVDLNGLCVDVAQPRLVTRIRSNAAGVATRTVPLPALPDGTIGFFQAVTTGATAATSDIVTKVKLSDAGGTFHVEGVHIADIVPGVSWDGVFARFYTADAFPNPNLPTPDLCGAITLAVGTPFAGATACPNCEFSFDVNVLPAYEELQTPGDCLDFIGVDASTYHNWSDTFTDSWGADLDYYVPGYGTYQALMIYNTDTYAWQVLGFGAFYGSGQIGFGLVYNGTFYY
ncbi:MAG: hypothetical protein H6733_00985 [Alphaproteobacteria bacterium]|nr:hypothetical protein [Alphaproteobacteria bacterium]